MNDNFIKLVTGESAAVSEISSVMAHGKAQEAKLMLNYLNSVIDYYLERKDGGLRFPVVHIPNAPDWAESVFAEFLVLKMALSYGGDVISRLKAEKANNTIYTSGDTRKDKAVDNYRTYIKKIVRAGIPGMSLEGKNLMFCEEKVLNATRGNRNVHLETVIGGFNKLRNEAPLSVCSGIGRKEIDKETYDDEAFGDTIKNLFVFYRNASRYKWMNGPGIRQAGMPNVRNCFVFLFSPRPQRLYRTRERMVGFGHDKFEMLPEKEALRNKDFITLTEEESLYLFGREHVSQHVFIPDNQLMFNELIGSYVNSCQYPVLERNHLSLCLTLQLCDDYLKKAMESAPEELPSDTAMSMEYQLDVSKEDVIPRIREFIGEGRRVAFILPHDASRKEKEALAGLFGNRRKISFYSFSDMKPKKGKIMIKESCIISLTYRGHFAGSPFHRYPNSLDPYIVNEGQRILEIIHGFAFNSVREWDMYEYRKLLALSLNSEFRKERGYALEQPTKPTVEKAEYDSEPDAEGRGAVPRHSVIFEDKTRTSVLDTDLIICGPKSGMRIMRVSDATDEYDTLEGMEIQKLSDLDDIVKIFMENQDTKGRQSIESLRKYFVSAGRITEKEAASGNTIWNILLRHKVEAEGEQAVYDEIMKPFEHKISLTAFRRWHDPDDSMILPRDKKTQRRLMECLGLTDSYLFAMRAVKRAAVSDTRGRNETIDRFMLSYLLEDITPELFEEFRESSVNESFQIQDQGDLEAFVSSLREEIRLKKVEAFGNSEAS